MSADTLLGLVRHVPFRPFRITMVNGRVYDVHHPEMIHVTRRDCFLYIPKNTGDELDQQMVGIGMEVIDNATHIDSPSPARPQDSAA